MLNNGHHNPSCAFAEQIVSYLYGETNNKEKAAFDVHLNSCSTCTDELAGFSFVRSSIVEWKNEEFLNLETPSIKIPYPIAVSTEKQSWLAELRKLFTFSPMWATAFAAVIICVGLILLAVNFSNNNDVAESDNTPIESIVSPSVEPKDEQPIEKISDNIASKSLENNQSKPSEIAPRIVPKNRITKTSNKPTKVLPNSNNPTNVRQIKEDKTTLVVKKREVPKLNNLEDEEDNSLRLADLFAEVERK